MFRLENNLYCDKADDKARAAVLGCNGTYIDNHMFLPCQDRDSLVLSCNNDEKNIYCNISDAEAQVDVLDVMVYTENDDFRPCNTSEDLDARSNPRFMAFR